MAAAAGVEPATCSLGESRSIQLSYATAFCIFDRRDSPNPLQRKDRCCIGYSNRICLIPAERKMHHILYCRFDEIQEAEQKKVDGPDQFKDCGDYAF